MGLVSTEIQFSGSKWKVFQEQLVVKAIVPTIAFAARCTQYKLLQQQDFVMAFLDRCLVRPKELPCSLL